MEESAKRKERLQAMRLEASRAVASAQHSHSFPSSIGQMQSLSPSPLPRLADRPPLETPPPARRFDFYTDPTSAVSASKRMRFSYAAGGFGPFSPQRPTPLPPPSFPYGPKNTYVDNTCPAFHQMPHQSDCSSHGTPSRVSHYSPWGSAIQFQTPSSGHQGSPVTGPGSWNASGGSSGHSFAARPSGSFSSSPHFRPGGSQLSNHRTNRPHSNLGRGRGSNSRLNRSGGKRDDIASYFMKSMLEDPWCDTEPVVGDILEPMSSPGYRRPESTSGKNNQMPETENNHKLDSNSSLAEFLAASLKETINDTD
ncbi:protein SICKLE-like [Curcuma longa]|uniref:protein SICKLE-like n=1 Tax=Curcuma longa TaxID=136217 RepID=UPI003D9E0D3C